MNLHNDELEQKLWELEFGLLAEDEQTSLRARIDAEPDVAQAWERVRSQTKLVAEAAQVRVSPIRLSSSGTAIADSASRPKLAATSPAASSPATGSPAAGRLRRLASWAIAAAATLLISLAGVSWYDTVGARPRAMATATPAPKNAAPKNAVSNSAASNNATSDDAADTRALGTSAAATPLSDGAVADTVVADTVVADPAAADTPLAETAAANSVRAARGASKTSPLGVPALPATPAFNMDADQSTTRFALDLTKITVDVPADLHENVSARLYLQTTTSDGEPKPAEVVVRLRDRDGNVKFSEKESTDQRGRGSVVLPAPLPSGASELEVAEADKEAAPVARAKLTTHPESYVTHVSTDRRWYRSGDLVRFRSVTLSRFGLQADRDTTVAIKVTDPSGKELSGYQASGTTTKGVFGGELSLPEEASEGKYTLVATSTEGIFPESQRDFYVRTEQTRSWDVDVTWSAESFGAGENVKAKVDVKSVDGKPANDVNLFYKAHVDGHPIPLIESKEESLGKRQITFQLPQNIEAGEGVLEVTPGSDAPVDERIPIRVARAQLDFYPEGGELVAGVESRVYVHSHDGLGRPMSVTGEILGADGSVVTSLTTVHEGRGSFQFTPQADATYSLRLSEPAGVETKSVLPTPSAQSTVVMHCGKGVFDSNESMVIQIRSSSPPPELTIAANCRGAIVGYQTVAANSFVNGSCDVSVDIAPEAAGVIRLTVYQGAEPMAERLVYRIPRRQLSFQWDNLNSWYAPGSHAKLQISSVDEAGMAVPGAVLGFTVVDEAALLPVRPAVPRMATHFAMVADIEAPEKLEDANFYLEETTESKVALDLLLGTQGWRRFRQVPLERLAQSGLERMDSLSATASRGDAENDKSTLGERRAGAVQRGIDSGFYYARNGVVDSSDHIVMRFDNYESLAKESVKQGKSSESITEGYFGVSPPIANPQPGNPPSPNSETVSAIPVSPQAKEAQILHPEYADAPPATALPAGTPASTWWYATNVLAVGLLVASLLALVFRWTTSWRTASVGLVASSLALLLGFVMTLSHPDQQKTVAHTFDDAVATAPAMTESAPNDFTAALPEPASPPTRGQALPKSRSAEPEREAAGVGPAGGAGGMVGGGVTDGGNVGGFGRPTPPASEKSPSELNEGDSKSLPSKVPADAAGPPASATVPAPGGARTRAITPSANAPAAAEPKAAKSMAPPPPAEKPAPVALEPAPVAAPFGMKPTPVPPEPAADAAPKVAPKKGDMADRFSPIRQAQESLSASGGLPAAGGAGMGGRAKQDPMPAAVPPAGEGGDGRFRRKMLEFEDSARTANEEQLEKQIEQRAARRALPQKKSLPDTRAWKSARGFGAAGVGVVREYAHRRQESDKETKQLLDRTEVLYWHPLLITDENGHAEVEFDFSDAVTTYRIQVDGHENGRLKSDTRKLEVRQNPTPP